MRREIGALASADSLHQATNSIQRGIDRVADIGSQSELTLAHRAEEIFDQVRDLLDLGLAGRACAARPA